MANEITIFIDADTSGLRQGLENAQRQVETFQDRIQSIADVGQKLAGLGASLTVGLTVPIVALGKSAIEAYGDIQALQKGLEAVLGSSDRAGKEFERLKEVAKLPGLGLEEAVKGSINLQSIGLSAKTSRDILLQFGNAVATVGKGRAEFERAVYGVQQLANTDFPLGEDLNIIKDAVPQVSRLLKEAFGTSRSDDLQKLKISSKQVLDVILDGLGKLPRVTGGIKGAFENLSDSMKTALGRIGKIIDDNFDISGIIDKITDFTDKLITKFESLDPAFQKTILVVSGLAAAIGPLLVAVGGFLALIPTMTSGIAAIGTAFTFLTGPIGLTTVAILGVVAAVVANWDKIRPYLEETIDRFKRLYNESTIFRIGIGTLAASFESAFKIAKEALGLFYNNFKAVGKAILETFSGIGEVIEGVLTFDASKIKNGIIRSLTAINKYVIDFSSNNVRSFGNLTDIILGAGKKYNSFRFDLSKKTDLGIKDLGEDIGTDKLIQGLAKTKKEAQRQLAELIPEGSIADYKKRAELLRKSIEYSVDGLVKVRGLDKFGKDTDKNGNPYYTGLVLPIEQAYEQLEKLQVAAGELDLQPIKINSRGLLDQFGNEFKTTNDLLASESTRTYNILNTQLPGAFASGFAKIQEVFKQAKLKEAVEELNKDLSNVLNQDVTQGITDAFSAIGSAFTTGGNLFKSLGTSLLNSFGKILSDLGKQMIQYGVSLLALKIAMKSLNPYIAIAAGAALVAIGAGVSAFAQKQNESIGSGSGTTSTAASVPNYTSSSFTGGGGGVSGEVQFRISGPDLIGAFNRNVSAQDRVSAG